MGLAEGWLVGLRSLSGRLPSDGDFGLLSSKAWAAILSCNPLITAPDGALSVLHTLSLLIPGTEGERNYALGRPLSAFGNAKAQLLTPLSVKRELGMGVAEFRAHDGPNRTAKLYDALTLSATASP